MDLEELRQQWQRLDEKFDQTLKLERELLRQTVLPTTQRRINRLVVWPVLDIAFCVGVLLIVGSFLVKHCDVWLLVVCATVVMVAATMLLTASIRQLVYIAEVDWNGTLASIQGSLSRLRISKITQFKWVILSSPLVGFCALIVGLQWLLDRLPVQHFILEKLSPSWVGANVAFGVFCIPFGYAVARFLAKRFHGRGWWQRALDDISGTSLKRAGKELERWTNLDKEVSNLID